MGDLGAHVVEAGIFGGLATHDDDGEVVKGVGVAFAEFIHPDNGGVIQHVAVLTSLGSLLQFIGEVGELFGKPDVDFLELVLSVIIFVWFVTQGMVPFVDVEPAHAGLSHGAHKLK